MEQEGRGILAERLEQVKKEKQVSNIDIAAGTGIHKTTIASYIRGESLPIAKHLIALCRYFDISADWLLGLHNFRRLKK